jgi:anaerobic magnesium-protoporphyrin IX monomethyl ester cyclase
MNVLFINVKRPLGPVNKVKKGVVLNNSISIPQDLLYPATILQKNKFKVKIIDANTKRLSDGEVVLRAKRFKPKLVIVNTTQMDRWQCPFLTINETIAIAEKITAEISAKVVVIGPHGSVTPEWVLEKSNAFDFVVRDEPEFTLLELAQKINSKKPFATVKGISYKKGTKIVNNKRRELIHDLDKLPMPAYNLLPLKLYPYALTFSSRGCPFKCVFCFQNMYGPTFRANSPKRVVNEMQLLEKLGFEKIYFQDLEFAIDNKRVFAICEEILKRKLKIKWHCNARFDDMNDEKMLAKMKEANCILINFGLETASKEVMKASNKKLSLDKVESVVTILRKIKLDFATYMLLALPGETKKSIRETVRFMVKNNIGMGGGSLPIPYPGTVLFFKAQQQGLKPTWENIGSLAGKVNTNILHKVGGEKNLYAFVWKTFFEEKYGKTYYLKPAFWSLGIGKVLSKTVFIAKKGNFRKVKKMLKGKF